MRHNFERLKAGNSIELHNYTVAYIQNRCQSQEKEPFKTPAMRLAEQLRKVRPAGGTNKSVDGVLQGVWWPSRRFGKQKR